MLMRFYCPGNYSFIPPRIWKEGTGGAEYALMLLAKALSLKGHRIQIINNCEAEGFYDMVEYLNMSRSDELEKTRADVTAFFRVPIENTIFNTGHYVFYTCDQYGAGSWEQWFQQVNPTIICISDYHAGYIKRRYNIGTTGARIRTAHIGCNISDYEMPVAKERFKFIYCSQIDRGLGHIATIWPMVKAGLPDAKLYVTGDRSLWGVAANTAQYAFLTGLQDVYFLGNIPRAELVRHQLTSEINLMPASYFENFGIAIAECMAAGAVPITTGNAGAVGEVVGDAGILVNVDWKGTVETTFEIEMGKLPGIEWGPYYQKIAAETIALAQDHTRLVELQNKARRRANELWNYDAAADRFLRALER